MDLYSDLLDLNIINLVEDENQDLGESEENFENQGNVTATEISTECLTDCQESVPITESGTVSEERIPNTETCIEREINSSQTGTDNQENVQIIEVSTIVEVTDDKGNQQTCSTKEDSSEQFKSAAKQKKRKKKYYLEDIKPTRESKRKRKCPLVINYERNDKPSRTVWTNDDKVKLINGLEEFGVDNVTSILRKYLPHKSYSSLSNQIRICRDYGRYEQEKKLITAQAKKRNWAPFNCVVTLEEWIEHFENLADLSPQRLFALSNVFLLISEYSNLPSPNQCEGIDLRAMYQYLHCVLNGKPHFGLNPKTAEVLHQSINHGLRHTACYNKRMPALVSISQQNLNMPEKTYTRISTKRVVPELAIGTRKAIFKLPDLNALNIPPNMLIKEEEYSDSDSDLICSFDDKEDEDQKKEDLHP